MMMQTQLSLNSRFSNNQRQATLTFEIIVHNTSYKKKKKKKGGGTFASLADYVLLINPYRANLLQLSWFSVQVVFSEHIIWLKAWQHTV